MESLAEEFAVFALSCHEISTWLPCSLASERLWTVVSLSHDWAGRSGT